MRDIHATADPMKVLAIDTCTRRVGVALSIDSELHTPLELTTTDASRKPQHVEQLVPMIDAVLRSRQLTAAQLDLIAVTNGPGMFTGLRVGLATAATIAAACSIPVAAVGSLDVLTAGVRAPSASFVVATLDARRAEIYFSLARIDGAEITVLHDADIASPEDARSVVIGHTRHDAVVVCGDGVAHHDDWFDRDPRFVPDHTVTAPPLDHLVRLGVEQFNAGLALRAEQLRPRYLRASDAEINAAKVSGGTM